MAMDIRIITAPITKTEALEIAKEFYVDMVKGVVDLEKEIIALGGEYHMDANNVLIEQGSSQPVLWGLNSPRSSTSARPLTTAACMWRTRICERKLKQ